MDSKKEVKEMIQTKSASLPVLWHSPYPTGNDLSEFVPKYDKSALGREIIEESLDEELKIVAFFLGYKTDEKQKLRKNYTFNGRAMKEEEKKELELIAEQIAWLQNYNSALGQRWHQVERK